jgi:hypothetical protein
MKTLGTHCRDHTMFHPSASQRLVHIRAMLEAWSQDADGFRVAVAVARKGQRPTSSLLAGVEGTHDGLTGALEEIDRLMSELPPGHADFSQLLLAQTVTLGLLDSVGNSLDRLERHAAEPKQGVTRDRHALVSYYRQASRAQTA